MGGQRPRTDYLPIPHRVSMEGVSLHCPLNRVLAHHLHFLCLFGYQLYGGKFAWAWQEGTSLSPSSSGDEEDVRPHVADLWPEVVVVSSSTSRASTSSTRPAASSTGVHVLEDSPAISTKSSSFFPTPTIVQYAFQQAAGLSSDFDLLRWVEYPLRAWVLRTQVQSGLWRRNGEIPHHEVNFFANNYWHHTLVDQDVQALRLCLYGLADKGRLIDTVLDRFEVGPCTISFSDQAFFHEPGSAEAIRLQRIRTDRAFNSNTAQKDFEQRFSNNLQSVLLHLTCLLDPIPSHEEKALIHLAALLAAGPKSHSQLYDPVIERML